MLLPTLTGETSWRRPRSGPEGRLVDNYGLSHLIGTHFSLWISPLRVEPPRLPFGLLPDELVLIIVEFATPSSDYGACLCPGDRDAATGRALVAVCRRFNRLATPFLYGAFVFSLPRTVATRRLCCIAPSHRQHCRKLDLTGTDFRVPNKADWVIANDSLAGCSEVRCLSFRGGFQKNNAETWYLIANMLASMRFIDHLTLSREDFGLFLPHVMKHVGSSSLQHLAVHGMSKYAGGVPSGRHGTASFTTLELSNYEEDAAATAHLIRWPRHLRRFFFESCYNSRRYMDLAMFGSWLSIHKDTLEYIHIGYLSHSGRGTLLDASEFPVLKALTLSRYSFSDDLESCAADASCLLAPQLETFTWSFSIRDQYSEAWYAFGEKEERWLQQFPKAAASRPSLPLKRINVVFRPDYWDSREEHEYPWDRLDRAKEFCRRLRIELSYSRPPLSKDAWLKHIAEERRATREEERRTIQEDASSSASSAAKSREESPRSGGPEQVFEGRDIREFFPPIRGSQNT